MKTPAEGWNCVLGENLPPRVSILMGSYNPRRKQYLYAAVHSLIRQSFSDWELLVYDDGSDKASAKILQEACQIDGRIRYLRGDCNKGLSHALNQCILHARGDYLARMDDDDLSLPKRLQTQVDFLDSHPEYQWVGCAAWLFDGGSIWGKQRKPAVPQAKDFLFNSPYIHPTVMFRRQALTQAGGYSESPAVLQCEDYELFLRLHAQGMRGYNLPDILFCYREGRSAYRKRSYARRIREAEVRLQGFRKLGILTPLTAGYVLKPLLIGLIPTPLYAFFKRKQYKNPTSRQERRKQYGKGSR